MISIMLPLKLIPKMVKCIGDARYMLKATRNGALTKAGKQKISPTLVKYLIYITLKPKFCSTKIRSYQARKYSKITPLPIIYMLPLKIVVTFHSIPNKLVFFCRFAILLLLRKLHYTCLGRRMRSCT